MADDSIKVRLTPEGVNDVIAAMRKVQAEAGLASKAAAGGVNSLTEAFNKLKGLLPAIGITAVAAGLAHAVKSATEFADAMGKAAQRVGTTSEAFSTLAFGARTAELSQDELEKSLGRLTKNIGGLLEGTSEADNAFKKLGLTAGDFEGKDTAGAFDIIANKIAQLPDGIEKSRIAIELFGKSGTKLIPLMKDLSAEGFEELKKRAEDFGFVVSDEFAQKSEKFNDSLTLLGVAVKKASREFFDKSGLISALTEVSNRTGESIRQFGTFKGLLIGLGSAFNHVFKGNDAERAAKEISDIENTIQAARKKLEEGPDTSFFGSLLRVDPKQAAETRAQILKTIDDNVKLLDEAQKRAADIEAKNKPAEKPKEGNLNDQFNARKKLSEFTKELENVDIKTLQDGERKRTDIRLEEIKAITDINTARLATQSNQIDAQRQQTRAEETELQSRVSIIRSAYSQEVQAAQTRNQALNQLIKKSTLSPEQQTAVRKSAEDELNTQLLAAAQAHYQKLLALQGEYVNRYKQASQNIKDIDDERYRNKIDQENFFRDLSRRNLSDYQKFQLAIRDADELEGQLRDAVLSGNIDKARELQKALVDAGKAIAQAQGAGINENDAERTGKNLISRANDLLDLALVQKRANEVASQTTAKENIETLTKSLQDMKAQLDDLQQKQLSAIAVGVKLNQPSIFAMIADIKDQLSKETFPISVTPNVTLPLGNIPGRLNGGAIPGTPSLVGGDNMIIAAKSGEYMQPVAAHQFWGTQNMERIARGEFPGFAQGGPIGGSTHGTGGDSTTLHIDLGGGKKIGPLRGSRETVRDLTTALQEISRGVS